MAWADTWITNARTALCALRGDGPTGVDGQPLPNLSPVDTISVVGQVAPGVRNALVNFHRQANQRDAATAAIASGQLDADGTPTNGLLVDLPGNTISATAYLAGFPQPGAEYRRGLTAGAWALGQTYEPWTGSESQLLSFVDQCMTDWAKLCDASAAAILAHGADLTTPWQTEEAQAFWAALGAVCSDLDVLNENPPVDMGTAIVGALRYSLHQTEEFLGKSVAQVSEEVGTAAGNVAKGFFDNAGLLSVAVAGIALFLFLK